MKLSIQKPDTLGAIASTLCVIHCLATPLLFIAHTCSLGGCETTPVWWRNLDYFFLAISFFAIYRSVQTTSKNYMKYALWLNWGVLFSLILNEKQNWANFNEMITYAVAISLSILHLYNLKYCQCKNDICCNSK